ncbi:hypothetical protein [Streptomyces sp. SID12501]|uniref:Uncharacterized protein n=1 Tax=Streptomyces sp. SID12501 TaxID=2706042 RepID=A0A6B3BX77_9ACTN|nr:hypothetical protein [Streptomyces sp. SID12501]NEC88945.1 hypothetical protein [Streptomyces sp. SID12501]
MNVNVLAEQASRWRKRLEGYGRTPAVMAMSGSAVLLTLDILEIIQ